MKKKNNLDERQELIMLRIEHNGFWIAFWMLFALMLIEEAVSGMDFRIFGGEAAVLIVISIYLTAACIRNGIWDRRLEPNFRTNFLASLAGGVVSGIAMGIGIYLACEVETSFALLTGADLGLFVFVICLIATSAIAKAYKKKAAELEGEFEDEAEEE